MGKYLKIYLEKKNSRKVRTRTKRKSLIKPFQIKKF